MKLVQAGKAYEPHIGGVETVMRDVATGAVARGWQSRVVVASDDRRACEEQRAGTTVVRTPTLARPLSLPLTYGYGRALSGDSGARSAIMAADILLIHEPTLLAAAALQLRPSHRDRFGKVAVWWHSDIIRQKMLKPLYQPLIERHLSRADHIIVATPHHISSSEVLPRFAEKISVVPYGIDLNRYMGSPERERRVAALRERFLPQPPTGQTLIVSAGRLARYKGIGHLVEAFEQVTDAHLLVAGDGPCADDVTSSNAARTGRLTVLPHLDDEEFVDLLWAADVFAMPSIHNSEAFGIAQVEAMVCRTPVVTYNLPTGVTWVNRHEQTGLVAELGDVGALARALQTLVDDTALRRDLAEGAHQWATNTFDVKEMHKSLFALLGGDTTNTDGETDTSPTNTGRVRETQAPNLSR